MATVATLNDRNEVTSFKFLVVWSKSHYNRRPITYNVKEERLADDDKETLRLLQNMVTHLPKKPQVFNVRQIVKADTTKEFKAALGSSCLSRDLCFDPYSESRLLPSSWSRGEGSPKERSHRF